MTFRDNLFAGKVALVVGGTGGIGAAIADIFATLGAVVTVTVGGTCSGACASLQAGSAGSVAFIPATTITDVPLPGQTPNVAVANGVSPTFNARLF